MEGEEDDSTRSSRLLFDGNLASRSHVRPGNTTHDLAQRREIHSIQILSPVCERVRANGESGNMVIGNSPLNVGHTQ